MSKTNQIKIRLEAQIYTGCELCLFQREEIVGERQTQKGCSTISLVEIVVLERKMRLGAQKYSWFLIFFFLPMKLFIIQHVSNNNNKKLFIFKIP